MDDDHVVHAQPQLRGGRPGRLDRATQFRRLHVVLLIVGYAHTSGNGDGTPTVVGDIIRHPNPGGIRFRSA
ncbi:hypothetical protein GCM10010259_67720 [Streptomyces daghestanicus]|uniref:Transposase n=1 Tax=Streptomyces daghestanicus TaxID=66885 RepID=A0ABQ3Q7W2_9ACTN|nr:hypothetical protein GCM10010259_67720 [Streptomyces daghestanicus]GHI33335.1 hypothetical protein Sdagh_50650 [Streptomyces daghestanicus]